MLTRYICPIQFVVVGSPDYLQRNEYLKTSKELSKHVGISYYYSQFADEIFFEGQWARDSQIGSLAPFQQHYYAVSSGLGWHGIGD